MLNETGNYYYLYFTDGKLRQKEAKSLPKVLIASAVESQTLVSEAKFKY